MNESASGERFSPENLLYDGASKVIDAETVHLKEWRGQEPCVGLALSGGGIRSATYCLGVLQAMAYRRALPQVDYLSTVSGGGYIGVSLSYLLHQSTHGDEAVGFMAAPKFDVSRENFPYVSYPMVGVVDRVSEQASDVASGVPDTQLRESEKFKGRLVRRLRQSTNYLAPGDGITLLSLAGVVLRNLVLSLVVHVALLVVLFEVLYTYKITTLENLVRVADSSGLPPANPYLYSAVVVVMIYGLLSMLYVFCTRLFDRMERHGLRLSYQIRRRYEVTLNYLFLAALVFLVVGGLPWLYELLDTSQTKGLQGLLPLLDNTGKTDPMGAGLVAALIGVIGNVWGFVQARSGKKHRIPTGLVVGVASAVLAIGLLLLVYMLTGWLHANHGLGGVWGILALAVAVLLAFGWWPEANYVSLHRYYRDRLMELFLPDLEAVGDSMMNAPRPKTTEMQPGDATLLGSLCQVPMGGNYGNKLLRGPYPLINANVVLTASKHPRYRARGGDNYIFSPLYCGSRATDWQATDCKPGSGFTLATAMAISGAAVNPNAGPGGKGVTRQPVLSVLMGMLNLRLGYWATNQNHASASTDGPPGIPWFKPNQLFPGLAESFGRFFLNEHARFSLLTDGGHFENLGLYELVRRRLQLIIVCDASADPNFNFSDLANAIQKVRADFGAIIDINDEQLSTLMPPPQEAAGKSGAPAGGAQQGYLIACIRYSMKVGQSPDTGREVGTLILLKATAFKGSPADVFSYRRDHPEFPDQSTADQFFDEKQFDSYRELGYVTADRMLKEIEASRLDPGEEQQGSKGYRAPTRQQIARLLFGLPEPVASNT
jgi:predicted acylesterase/phospholipase RssA